MAQPIFSVFLPWPSSILMPNRRKGHFRKIQPFVESARGSGIFYTKQALRAYAVPPVLSARQPVKITFGLPDRRRRDLDGLIGAMKNYLDGMAQALGVDDHIFRPMLLDDCMDPTGKGYVHIEIGEFA